MNQFKQFQRGDGMAPAEAVKVLLAAGAPLPKPTLMKRLRSTLTASASAKMRR